MSSIPPVIVPASRYQQRPVATSSVSALPQFSNPLLLARLCLVLPLYHMPLTLLARMCPCECTSCIVPGLSRSESPVLRPATSTPPTRTSSFPQNIAPARVSPFIKRTTASALIFLSFLRAPWPPSPSPPQVRLRPVAQNDTPASQVPATSANLLFCLSPPLLWRRRFLLVLLFCHRQDLSLSSTQLRLPPRRAAQPSPAPRPHPPPSGSPRLRLGGRRNAGV